jgi:hypothetical protein
MQCPLTAFCVRHNLSLQASDFFSILRSSFSFSGASSLVLVIPYVC